MNKLVFNSKTNEMQVVALTAEEIEQNEIDRTTVIPPQPPSEIEFLKQENKKLKEEDLNNKEAIAELYLLMSGGI
ncbi:hypothetical protein [Psychrobacillus sp. FSL K6-1267]|uniref:hypothetical protein n=1 Tax=Psychrobacillus sp. FSL K6-1267 TaxID=2921543 RepID=UPI0030FA0BBC